MSKSDILLEQTGPLWQVTLNRPQKANALSLAMLRQLCDIFGAAANDQALRALVMTGAGDRVFCAGADLSELTTDPDHPTRMIWDELSERLAAIPILTVAKLNGSCIGGGLTLALGCDIRLSARKASFGYPVLKNGIRLGEIDAARLRDLIGSGRASRLLLGGCKIGADEALAWGLIDGMYKGNDLKAATRDTVETALNADRDHLIIMKRQCRRAVE